MAAARTQPATSSGDLTGELLVYVRGHTVEGDGGHGYYVPNGGTHRTSNGYGLLVVTDTSSQALGICKIAPINFVHRFPSFNSLVGAVLVRPRR